MTLPPSSMLPFLITHSLFMALTGLCLAALVLTATLATRQGARLYTLLLLVLLPATGLALALPFLLHSSTPTLLLSFFQGVLIGPALSLVPLGHLKDAPPTWRRTAQELGATPFLRLRLLWLPLLGRSLAGSLCLAFALSVLGTLGINLGIHKAPLS
ncbi:hypothetical protein [Acetobacter sp. P1H12_c]|uniref:hypothetical protein n=1 Tax=Acetobacter sp. P1H12_c TaxID=2762621 RepID=UPI001C043369|nr:hypothetical protein [Acetobacter sp. P1H12_c]